MLTSLRRPRTLLLVIGVATALAGCAMPGNDRVPRAAEARDNTLLNDGYSLL